MPELFHSSRETSGGDPALSDDLFDSDAGTGLVTVSNSGLYNERLPVANMTVGEIRRRFADRMDIDPDSQAVLEGRPVRDDEVVRAGQLLTFVRDAGEKGSCQLTIKGKMIRAQSPEGRAAEMTIEQFVKSVAPPRMDTCGVVIPDGTKLVYSSGYLSILVHETPPQVRSLKWIRNDSHNRWRGASYRQVRIALPYLIVIATFENGIISDWNECFFRVAPLESEDDQLYYPALLNCSRFRPSDGRPLSWICTQHLNRDASLSATAGSQQIRSGFSSLMRCLLDAGFNWSSEDHEGARWFTESAQVDARIGTIERWEQATETEGSLFVLDVPWIKTRLSVKQVVRRIMQYRGANQSSIKSDRDMARIVFNQRAQERSA